MKNGSTDHSVNSNLLLRTSSQQLQSMLPISVSIIGRRTDPELEFIVQQCAQWQDDPRRSSTGKRFSECINVSIDSLHQTHFEYVLKDLKRRKPELVSHKLANPIILLNDKIYISSFISLVVIFIVELHFPMEMFLRIPSYPFNQQNAIILQLTKFTHTKLLQQFNFSKAYVYVYFDIQIKLGSIPQKSQLQTTAANANTSMKISKFRLIIQLNAKMMPKTTFNFYQICQGNFKNASGQPLSYKNTALHSLKKNGFFQGGITDPQLDTSVFGKYFQDESFTIKHDQPGVLGMTNAGVPHTNSQQFYITLSKQPEKDKKFVAFGLVVHGMKYLRKINKMADSDAIVPPYELRIQDCGEYVFQKCDFVGETKKDFELLDNSDILNTHIANYHGKKLMEVKAQRIKDTSYQQRQVQRAMSSSQLSINNSSQGNQLKLGDATFTMNLMKHSDSCFLPLINQETRHAIDAEARQQALFEFTNFESLTYKAIEIAAEKVKRKRIKYDLKKQQLRRQQSISDVVENRIIEEYEQEQEEGEDFAEGLQDINRKTYKDNISNNRHKDQKNLPNKAKNNKDKNNLTTGTTKYKKGQELGLDNQQQQPQLPQVGSVVIASPRNNSKIPTSNTGQKKAPSLLNPNNSSISIISNALPAGEKKLISINDKNTVYNNPAANDLVMPSQNRIISQQKLPQLGNENVTAGNDNNNDDEEEAFIVQQLLKSQQADIIQDQRSVAPPPSVGGGGGILFNILSTDIKSFFDPTKSISLKKTIIPRSKELKDTRDTNDSDQIEKNDNQDNYGLIDQLMGIHNTNLKPVVVSDTRKEIIKNQLDQFPMIQPTNKGANNTTNTPQLVSNTKPPLPGKEWWRKDTSRGMISYTSSKNASHSYIPQQYSYFHRANNSTQGHRNSLGDVASGGDDSNSEIRKSSNNTILDILNQQFLKAKENHLGFRRVISKVSNNEHSNNKLISSRRNSSNSNNNNNNNRQSDNELMKRACKLGNSSNIELLDEVSQHIISKSREEIGPLIIFSQIVEFKKFLANELYKKGQEDCHKELNAILPGLCQSIMMQLPQSLKKSLSQNSELLFLNRELTQEQSILRLDTKGTLTFMSKQAGFDISEVDEDW